MAGSKPRAAISWSGGKDSCAALARVIDSFDVVAMITMFDESESRSRSHGLRPEVLQAQAARLGLKQFTGRCTWQTYNDIFSDTLKRACEQTDISAVIFGDIMFEEHKQWAERQCAQHAVMAVEPLWGLATDLLFDEWVSSGSDALIVTARSQFLDHTWLGRPLRQHLLPDFVRLGVDPCGERGEYHTVVTNTPLFSSPMPLRTLGYTQVSGCWALDVTVDDAAGL
jgi:diphthine-ammonia ligase